MMKWQGHGDLLNAEDSIVDRIRGARNRSGHVSWWKRQFANATTTDDLFFWNLTLYAWASPRVLSELFDEIEASGEAMSADRRRFLRQACRRAHRYSMHARRGLSGFRGANSQRRQRSCRAALFDRLPISLRGALVSQRFRAKIEDVEISSAVFSIRSQFCSQVVTKLRTSR